MTKPACCADKDPHADHKKADWILITCTPVVLAAYALAASGMADGAGVPVWARDFSHSVHDFLNTMWWGVLIGIVFLAILSRIPRDFIIAALGPAGGAGGIARAMGAGVLLDLCNHGILMVGAKLYERGASTGQVMAFLIASPWNSLSITFILAALIGWGWTFTFIGLSVVIAFITGMAFDALVKRGVLPPNPNRTDIPEGFDLVREGKAALSRVVWTPALVRDMLFSGISESRIVVRWLLFGVIIASALRVFLDADDFSALFGPTVLGLMATVGFATVLEVCSEGSSPIAADFLNRAAAPGNAFAFLMAGVATDYTEIMVLKDTTRSWKTALFLPLLTLPQVIILALILNMAG